MLDIIHWLGHASFKLAGEAVVYIDPWKLKSSEPADLVLVTHSHYDHFSPEDIAKIQKEDTIVIAPPDCRGKLSGDVRYAKPGDRFAAAGVTVEAFPAYNIGKPFHPRANKWMSYLVTVSGTKIYHVGDSDAIPEMENVVADVVLVPVGGTYTMNAKEAAALVNRMQPKLAIPMHFATVVGTRKDAENFKQLCAMPVEILERES